MRGYPRLIIFPAVFIFLFSATAFAKFTNPFSSDGCKSFHEQKFAGDWKSDEKAKFCANIEGLVSELNALPASNNKARIEAAWGAWHEDYGKIGKMSYFSAVELKKSIVGKILGTTTFMVADHLKATVWLKDSLLTDKKGYSVFLHETQHFADGIDAYKNQTSITSYELERRGYETESLFAEITPETESFSSRPKFWDDSWRKLSARERDEKRQKVIYDWLDKSPIYPNSRPRNFQVYNFDVLSGGGILQTSLALDTKGQKVFYMNGRPLVENVVMEKTTWDGGIAWTSLKDPLLNGNSENPAFEPSKPNDANDPNQLWQAAVQNEKKLQSEMADYLYNQNVFIQCLNKERKPVAEYVKISQVNRKTDGGVYEKILQFPDEMPCVTIEAADLYDYTTLYWVIPALDKRDAKFVSWETIDGIEAGKFAIAALPVNDTKDIGKRTDNRYFYGNVWVSKTDGQIIRLDGHTKPDDGMHKYPHLRADRKRTLAGIWLPSQVAGAEDITADSGYTWRMKLLVQYKDYKRFGSDVKILDDEPVAENK